VLDPLQPLPGSVNDSEGHIAAGLDQLDDLSVQGVRHLLTIHLDDDISLTHARAVGRPTRPTKYQNSSRKM
jgi:hypothetical protein